VAVCRSRMGFVCRMLPRRAASHRICSWGTETQQPCRRDEWAVACAQRRRMVESGRRATMYAAAKRCNGLRATGPVRAVQNVARPDARVAATLRGGERPALR
jgi:hypothetical protein